MGSMVSAEMDVVVHKIWDCIQSANNWVTVALILWIFNIEPNRESSVQEESTEWMLIKTVFDDINMQLEFKPNIYLFASSLNKQILKFVLFRPNPKSIAVNVFIIDWGMKVFMHFHHYTKSVEGQCQIGLTKSGTANT